MEIKQLDNQLGFKVYPKKIDIYLKNKRGFWQYECSTKAYKTCKTAKHNFCVKYCLDHSQVKCSFA